MKKFNPSGMDISSKMSSISKKKTDLDLNLDMNEKVDNMMTGAFGQNMNANKNEPIIDADYIKR